LNGLAGRRARCTAFGAQHSTQRTLERGNTMPSATKDKIEGTFHEVKGKAKQIAGNLTDNPKLKAKGLVEKTAGKAQRKMGEIKKVIGS
jgi:uncharacterized protein YjbJ (UPF0337 family)